MHCSRNLFFFLTCHNLEADELHILHLGVLQYFLGSVLWLLVFEGSDGNHLARFDTIWTLILEQYTADQQGNQYTNLTISSFADPKKYNTTFPRLRGRGCEVKSLVVPLLNVWKAKKRNSAFDNNVCKCLGDMASLICILDEFKADAFLPDDSAVKFLQLAESFLKCYCWLSVASEKRKLVLFNVVPKLHFMWHMAWRAKFLNPRLGATFIDEDFVKHMKKVTAMSVSGTPMHEVPKTLVGKYRWGLSLDL